MNFASPRVLWLLVILIVPLVLFLWWAWRKRQELITKFISSRLIAQLKVGVSPQRQILRMSIFVLAIIFLILALARPQWGSTKEEAHQRGLDIMVAVDTSKSMLAGDVKPNRLARAKLAAMDLMRQAKTDRMGLIAFAGDAFLQCPLTLDDAAFSQSVDSLDTQTISQGGTALSAAIHEADRAFKDQSDNHKVLVLFTDGEDHETGAVDAAEAAAKDGIVIFTVGVGTPQGEQIRIKDERGKSSDLLDDDGKPVKSQLNEEMLRDIARAGKGFYLLLGGTKTMSTLYDQGIAPLPKNESSAKLIQRQQERFHWPLGIAVLLLVVEMFLLEQKRRRAGSTPAANPPGAAEKIAVVMVFLLFAPSAWAGTSSAQKAYKDGKFEDALKDYTRLLEKKKDDPRLHYNAGAAAYQSHKFDEAIEQFNAALESPDLPMQQRAYYNLGNTYYRIGQQAKETDKKQAAWENAIKQFDSALTLGTNDLDAKFNKGFVTERLEELKKQQQQDDKDSKDQEPSEAAKAAKARADEAVKQRQYKQALEIMEASLKGDPTTQHYGEYIKRLQEVNGVAVAPDKHP